MSWKIRVASLVVVAALAACTKTPPADGAAASAAVADAGPLVPEFSSKDANHWVNGAPAMLSPMRGDVVLVEAWHRL
jgi:hypothetical protein